MGVINVTPDSFSDGGRFLGLDRVLAQAERLALEGADWLDIGGESTRPGADPVEEAEEMRRVLPAIEALSRRLDLPLSVDTTKPAVARAAIAAGARLWNDVSALSAAPESLAEAARLGCQVVLMHCRGEPRTMQNDPRYEDVVGEVRRYLLERAGKALAAGVRREHLWLDPGIGFGKTPSHNLALLDALPDLVDEGFPVLVGASRKGFIRAVDPQAATPGERLGGSIAAAIAAAHRGAAMVRVHNVRETVQALAVTAAIDRGSAI
jgi:dihydropteroate synthase